MEHSTGRSLCLADEVEDSGAFNVNQLNKAYGGGFFGSYVGIDQESE